MITNLLICALTFGLPAAEPVSDDRDSEYYVEDNYSDAYAEKEEAKEKFWAQKKSFRIGYEMHTFQNEGGVTTPVRFGAGLSRCKNIFLHKKPIGGMVKFALDHGFDLNYSMFNVSVPEDDSYTGPSGYLGNAPLEDYYEEQGESFDLNSIGSHYVSLGYAIGASITVNPVAKLRINGYVHFVPSVSLQLSSSSLNVGFMPYVKYGAELSYSKIGVGIEWGTGASTMSDYMVKLTGDTDSTTIPKAKYYSNYMRVYLAIRMGNKKK